MYCFVNKQR